MVVINVISNCNSIIGFGIDQGIANCGYAVVELTPENEVIVLSHGTITTKSDKPLPSRILQIYEMINDLANEYNGDILSCERLFFSPKQKTGRNKSASIMYTNMATGVIFLLAEQQGLFFKDFVPGTVKKYLTGSGRATKEEIEESIKKYLGDNVVIKTEHESDAIAIGITAVMYYKDFKRVLDAVNEAEIVQTDESYTKALLLVNDLKDAEQKILKPRLDVILKLMNKIKLYDKKVTNALIALEKAEKSNLQKDITIANGLINKLNDTEKASLSDRLLVVRNIIKENKKRKSVKK